jgi:ribosomal protein S18 acetylase RimI-like enzyme
VIRDRGEHPSGDSLSVEPLSLERLDEVVDVFADAFQDYPVMRFTVGPDGDVAARVRRLVRLFVTRRTARGGPMYGLTGAGGLLTGATLLTLPIEPPPPPIVEEISAGAWRDLGEGARLRYDAYAAASAFFGALAPHHHLNMIGVRRAYAGTGLGRRLLESVRRLSEEDPRSAGVSLTTENPRNVELYRRFGYEVVGHAPVGPGLETWGLFLPIS